MISGLLVRIFHGFLMGLPSTMDFKAKHTTVKRNRLKLKVFNELKDLGKFPILAVSWPFYGNKVVIFLRTVGNSLRVAP